MAYTYWRVQCTNTGVGGRPYFGLTTLEMRATAGGADQCSGGTASASSTFGTDVPANAFDGNTSTFWTSGDGALPDWIQYQFASPVDVVELAMRSRSGSEGTTDSPRIFEVLASNDGSTWTSFGVHYQPPWGSSETRIITVTGAVPGKHYWRILVNSLTNTATECTLDQIKMAFTSGGANKCIEFWASGTSFGKPATNARNSDDVEWWSQNWSSQPVWIAAQLSEPGHVLEVIIEAFNGWTWEAPRSFDVQSSPDGITWTTEWSVADTGAWSSNEVKTFDGPPPEITGVATALIGITAPSEGVVPIVGEATALIGITASSFESPEPSTGVATALIGITASATNAPGSYAVIENGIVTAVIAGALPDSTESILYFDLTGYELPEVGDYFEERCQTFSATPPVIPPGEIAPPYTPGSDDPPNDPDDEDYPEGPDEPGPTPIAHLVPVLIPFHVSAKPELAPVIAMATRTPLAAESVTAFDLTHVCKVVPQGNLGAGVVGARIAFEYWDGADWQPLDGNIGPVLLCDVAGDLIGPAANPVAGARSYVFLRAVVEGGDDTTDLEVGNLHLLAYVKTDPLRACVALPPWNPPMEGEATALIGITASSEGIVEEGIDEGECDIPSIAMYGGDIVSDDFRDYADDAALKAEYGADAHLVRCVSRSALLATENLFPTFGSFPGSGFADEVWGRVVLWRKSASAFYDTQNEHVFAKYGGTTVPNSGFSTDYSSGGFDHVHSIANGQPLYFWNTLVFDETRLNKADLDTLEVLDIVTTFKATTGAGGYIDINMYINGVHVAQGKWNRGAGWTGDEHWWEIAMSIPGGGLLTNQRACLAIEAGFGAGPL